MSLLLNRVTQNVQVADMKIALSSIQDDFVERMHFFDAVASVWGSAGSEKVKDLVVYDAGTAIDEPSPELRRAASVLTLRRQLVASLSESHYGETRLAELLSSDQTKAGKPLTHPPKELPLTELYVATRPRVRSSKATLGSPPFGAFTSIEGFWEWPHTVNGMENLPLVLQAAVLLDAWHQAEILEQMPRLAAQLVSSFMSRQGDNARLRALNIGLVVISRDRWTSPDRTTRLIGLLRGIEKASLAEAKEYDRVKAKHDELVSRILVRPNSALQKLSRLALRRPIVTVRTVSKELRVSEPTARSLIVALKLPEITGRKSGCVWSLA